MKKLTFWKSLFLQCALIVGSSSAWGQTTVKDVLTASDFTATSTTYEDFSNVSKTSDAVYAGNSAKDTSGNIQLRSKNSNSGIVSTTSGGTVKSVKITVGSGSKTIEVYGSNTRYSAASDLYDSNNKGTKIGSLTETGTITFPTETDYEYVGIRSNNGALYLSSVEIEWTTSGGGSTPTISVDPTSLSGFTYVEGSGPSAAQTISVSGSNLTENIGLSLGESSKYEMSTAENGNYTNSLTLTQSSGSVAATDIYVRLKSGLAKAANYEGTITLTSTGATDATVSLSGSVTGPIYTVTVATGLTGGEIEADPTSAAEGAEVTLSASPSSGYRLQAWDVYKTGDATTKVDVSNNKFTMPNYAVTVSATFELIPSVTYTLAKSVVPGRHYIIVGTSTNTQKAMGAQATNNRSAVDVTITENTITVTEDDGVYEFLVEVDDDGYFTIYDANTLSTGYLYAASSSSNHLKTQASNNANGEWAITIDGNGVASVVAKQSDYTHNVMRYNSSASCFSCYTSGQQDVYLFERVGDTDTQTKTINLNGSGYATYSAAADFEVTSGATAYTATLNTTEKKITCSPIDGKIPAGAGVLLYGDANAEVALLFTSGATALGDNDLNGTTKTGGGLATLDGGKYYYALSGDTFKKFTGEFVANKAFFESATELNSKTFAIVFEGETTAINGIEEVVPVVTKTRKVVKNGRLVIETANGEFTIDGARMK